MGQEVRWQRPAVAYLVVQATLAVAWWVGLLVSPDLRGRFELDPSRTEVLDAFLVADLVVFAGGSAVTAWMLVRRTASSPRAAALTAGGAAYATLYLAAWVVAGGHGWMGLVPMTAATTVTATIAAWTRP